MQSIKAIVYIFLILVSNFIYSQSTFDTIYLSEKETINCIVQEIGSSSIKYKLIDEEFSRVISKNIVLKIVFKNGKTENISALLNSKLPKSGNDWNLVKITPIADEVIGLKEIDLISAKAKGTTVFSSSETVKNRAYQKLKIVAALNGADITYIYSQSTQGSDPINLGTTTESYLFASIYTIKKFDIEDLRKILSINSKYTQVEQLSIAHNSLDLERYDKVKNENEQNQAVNNTGRMGTTVSKIPDWQDVVNLTNPVLAEDFIYVNADISSFKNKLFRVTYFDSKMVVLYFYEDKRNYNIILKQ